MRPFLSGLALCIKKRQPPKGPAPEFIKQQLNLQAKPTIQADDVWPASSAAGSAQSVRTLRSSSSTAATGQTKRAGRAPPTRPPARRRRRDAAQVVTAARRRETPRECGHGAAHRFGGAGHRARPGTSSSMIRDKPLVDDSDAAVSRGAECR